ncbi:serine/threonine-protein phosphatase, partial [bacterium]
DWWWHWTCGERAFVIIGDTTGHGAASALITSAARSAIATIETNPEIALEQVYTTLSHAIHSCGAGKMSMSAFILETNTAKKGFRYINASHVPALIIPKKAIVWTEFEHLGDPIASPLGVTNPNMQIGTKELEAGFRVVLLTDGLTERPDHKGVMVKERSGATYFTPFSIIQTDGQWHSLALRWQDLAALPSAPPDPNGQLDLDQITSISVGMNAKSDETTLEVSDFYVAKKTP